MPRNLFIVGTVNVDETTYMFSPKVLDRANVIEFDVTRAALSNYLTNPVATDFSLIDGRGDKYAEALVEMATTDPGTLLPNEKARYQAELMMFFDLFQREGAAFAFRTAKESVKGTSKNSSVRGVSVIDTDNWLSRLTFSAI